MKKLSVFMAVLLFSAGLCAAGGAKIKQGKTRHVPVVRAPIHDSVTDQNIEPDDNAALYSDLIIMRARARNISGSKLDAFKKAELRAILQRQDKYQLMAEKIAQDPARAFSEITTEALKNPSDPLARLFQGMANERLGNLQDALADYNEVIKLDREGIDGTAYYLRGMLQQDLNNPELALRDLDAALRLTPANAGVYHAKALLYMEKGDFAPAADNLQLFFRYNTDSNARDIVGASYECEELLAMGYDIKACREALGEPRAAQKTTRKQPPLSSPLNASFKQRPPLPEPVAAELGIKQDTTAIAWETNATDQEETHRALNYYRAIKKINSLPQSKANRLKARAAACAKEGDALIATSSDELDAFVAARELYNDAVILDPLPPFYLRRGAATLKLSEIFRYKDGLRMAREDFSASIASAPLANRGWDFALRGFIEEIQNDSPSAMSDFSSAISANAKQACFYLGRASSLLSLRRGPEAAADMNRFFELAGDSDFAAVMANGDNCYRLSLGGFATTGCKNAEWFASHKPEPFRICYPELGAAQ